MVLGMTRKWAVLGAVSLLLAACGGNEAEILEMAKAMKLNKQETAAFKVCGKSMKRAQPIFISGEKAVQLTKVPLEICACHAQTVAKLIKEESIDRQSKFAEYIVKAKRKPFKVGSRDMRSKATREQIGAQLVDSFKNCTDSYASKNAELAKGLIIPYELPKKKVKPPEGEQQATKS